MSIGPYPQVPPLFTQNNSGKPPDRPATAAAAVPDPDQRGEITLDRLRTQPPGAVKPSLIPKQRTAPVEYVLIHKPPAWLLPVLNDKRTRTGFDYQERFTQFCADVKARGVQQPIIAVQEDTAARVIDGETRRQAALLGGLETVPILVYQRELSESELVIAQLQANAQRQDFTALELAAIYQELMTLNGWTQSQLAKAVSVPASKVAKVLAISNRLDPAVQQMVAAGLSARAAYAISRLHNPQRQIEVAKKAVELPMAVESVEELVSRELHGSSKSREKPKPLKIALAGITVIVVAADIIDATKAAALKLLDAVKRIERDNLPPELLPSLLRG